jgi:hypothetical protein
MAGAGIMLTTLPLLAADGVLIVEKTTSGTTTTTNQIQIEKSRMRADVQANGGKQTMVFDGVRQVMLMINDEKKTYSEITKADIDKLGAQMSDAMAQMQASMAKLPPEQRAQMEKMMAGRMGGAGAAATATKTEYKKMGSDKVGKWTCDKWEGSQNGQKTVELCTVDPAALGFALADFDVTRDMQAFFAKLVPQGSENMFRIGKMEEQGFSGVPVRRVTFGARPSTSEMQEVTRQNFPDAMFAAPAGYAKEDSPFGGRGRGRGRGQD